MGGPECHGAHLAPVVPWLGWIQTWCWGALISTLGAMPATQLLKDPPAAPPSPLLPRRKEGGGEGSLHSPPTDLHWERGPAWWGGEWGWGAERGGEGGCYEHASSQFAHSVCARKGGPSASRARHPHMQTRGTHTSVPAGVGERLCVTFHHMAGVLLFGWLGGQGPQAGVGREGWPRRSRGKARGVGARRKQACIA